MILKIFFSWQVETDLQGFKNKAFLKDCIGSAIKQIENKGTLKGIHFELIEGLNKTSGNPEVAPLMFSQIDDCDIFIGDMTIVQRICSRLEPFRNKKGLYFRYSPNCNVYGEYNRALGLHKDFWKQIILLLNDTNKSPKEDSSVIPFDTCHRRWPITFNLKDNSVESRTKAKKELMKDLPDAIRKCAMAAREWIDKRYYPFSSWFKQSKDGRLNRYKIDVSIIDKYKTQILESKGVFFVIGPKGLSKTYLILKIFEDNEYTNNYLYVDCYFSRLEEFKSIFKEILEKVKDAIVVIDNCKSNEIEYILNLRLKYRAGNKIILITTQKCVENYNLKGIITVDTTQDLQNEVSLMFDEIGIISQQVRQQIEEFCDGNIGLVMNILSKITTVNSLDERTIVSLMYGVKEGKTERIILRSLALFDCIGWKEDKADELDTIILNKDITSIDVNPQVLLNNTRAFIQKLIRDGLIIEKGRTISLYPKSAARQLVVEWLEDVDEIRFIRVLKAILQSPNCNSLIQEFHDTFKYLGQYDEVRLSVKRLLKIGGGFDNISILNSDAGAMLMESFVQVNPEAVADLLSRVLNAQSIDELRKIEKGRRYLVWTIEKLCFKSGTFQQGAYLMMRMAISENESILNNATREFVRLFPIMLPATSASLNERLKFLKDNIIVDEQKPIILSAIKRATYVRDFVFFRGAESFGDIKLEPYKPESNDEIREYLKGCLDLVTEGLTSSSKYFLDICKLMEDNTIAMCDSGYADLILPKVREIIRIKDKDWDKMQETLSFFRDRVQMKMSPDLQLLYDEVLTSITKHDIVSRFARIEKESFQERRQFGYKDRLEIRRNKYKDLANEICKEELLTDDVLTQLIKVRCDSYPFGKVLADYMSSEDQIDFVTRYIQILDEDKEANISILCDFISSIDNDTFDRAIPILQHCRIPYTIFACFGAKHIMPDNQKFRLLHEMVEDKTSDVDSYLQYWYRIDQNNMTEDRLVILFSDILSFEDGFLVAINIMSFLSLDNQTNSYAKLIDLIENRIIEHHSLWKLILKNEDVMMVLKDIIQNGDRAKLAEVINESVIQAAAQDEYTINNYYIEEIYRILMNKYFNVIWPSLSKSLLSEGEESITFYNLKSLLGMNIVDSCKPVIMEGNHFDEMLDWCNDYPDIAPARLASMIPVAGDNNQLTPEALKLISLYADKNYVLDEIECTLDSFFATGSVVPYYEERKKMYSTLLQNERAEVREWAQRRINSCDYYIQHALNIEEERL